MYKCTHVYIYIIICLFIYVCTSTRAYAYMHRYMYSYSYVYMHMNHHITSAPRFWSMLLASVLVAKGYQCQDLGLTIWASFCFFVVLLFCTIHFGRLILLTTTHLIPLKCIQKKHLGGFGGL